MTLEQNLNGRNRIKPLSEEKAKKMSEWGLPCYDPSVFPNDNLETQRSTTEYKPEKSYKR